MKILSWPLVLFASSLGIVFAQTADSGHIPYAQEGALAACLGALIWTVKRLLTRTIPDQERTFRETLDKISDRSEKHDDAFRQSMDRMSERCESIQEARSDD